MQGRELESLGFPGPSHVRQALQKAKKPATLIAAVKKFRAENGLRMPSLYPALKLLDLHNVRRVDFHDAVANDLGEKLVGRLRELGKSKDPEAQKKLETQLENSFKLYRVPQVRPIVLETLKQMQRVPDRYLKIIVCDEELYGECAVTVRQQIWLKNGDLFAQTVAPVLAQYIVAKRNLECNIDPSTTNFFNAETTKTRRQQLQVQELTQMIGEHEQLYEKVMEIIKARYAETGNAHFCSLKMELLMAAHDANIETSTRIDPGYELAKCLDACVRERHMDNNLATRLRSALEKKLEPEELADVAMVAWDTHVVHFLCSIIVKLLRDSSALPRDSQSMQLLIKVLALGANSHKIVSSPETIPSNLIDAIFFTKFLPTLGKMVVEDVMRIEIAKGTMDVSEEFSHSTLLSEAPDVAMTFVKADMCASLLWLHQMIEMFPNKKRGVDMRGFLRYARHMHELRGKLAVHGPWGHFLIHRMISAAISEGILADDACFRILIDRLLIENLKEEPNVKYHLLRIVYQLHGQLGMQKSSELMEQISPENLGELPEAEKEKYEKDYNRTLERITPKPEEETPPQPMPQMTPAHPMMGPPTAQKIGPKMHPSMTPGPRQFATPGPTRPQFMTPRH